MAQETLLKAKLRASKISYRRAAPALGVTYQYLCDVCNGVHKSRRLSLRILQLCDGMIPLPPKPERVSRAARRGR